MSRRRRLSSPSSQRQRSKSGGSGGERAGGGGRDRGGGRRSTRSMRTTTGRRPWSMRTIMSRPAWVRGVSMGEPGFSWGTRRGNGLKESFCNNNEKVEESTVKSNVIEKKVTTRRNFRFERSSQGKNNQKANVQIRQTGQAIWDRLHAACKKSKLLWTKWCKSMINLQIDQICSNSYIVYTMSEFSIDSKMFMTWID